MNCSGAIIPRRGVLRGLVSLPLIGGGVTLIGSPAPGAVPIVEAMATTSLLADPKARARYAWAAFSAAMNEITANGAHGWVLCGGERRPFGHVRSGAFLNLQTVHYETGTEPRCPSLIVETHRDFEC